MELVNQLFLHDLLHIHFASIT